MREVARKLEIIKKENAFQIIVDDNEIKDVLSFNLNVKNDSTTTLALELDVIGSIHTVFDCS